MLKKIITWAIVIFLAFYLITQPTRAANATHGLLDPLKGGGDGSP